MAITNFMPSAEPIVLGRRNAAKVLILIHGLTLSGSRFAPVGEFLLPQLGPDWRIVLPSAPMQKVTWTGGRTTTAWFDLPVGSFEENQDETGIYQARDYIAGLVGQLVLQGVAAKNIVVGGFSQGGALSLLTALTSPETLGGAVCLSGYLPMAGKPDEFLQKSGKLPVFIGHGTDDEPIPAALGQKAAKILSDNGFVVDFKTYPIGHTVIEQELTDVAGWLNRL